MMTCCEYCPRAPLRPRPQSRPSLKQTRIVSVGKSDVEDLSSFAWYPYVVFMILQLSSENSRFKQSFMRFWG